MSKSVPQILIKFRNKSLKNHQISSQINEVLQKSLSDFRSALPEFCDPDLDPYLSICLEEVWEKLSNACELFEAAEQNRRFEYLNFEKIVKEYQEIN